MVIRAKYNGTCGVCGRRIRAGEEIEWSREAGSRHVACDGRAKGGEPAAPAYDGPTWRISGGSGYGCTGWAVGQVVRAGDRLRADGAPEWLTVLRATQRYVREDGLSFGVGDERGHVYGATCRAATPEEAAPAIARRAQAEARKVATARIAALARQIREAGTRPEGPNPWPAGERLLDTFNIYGGGACFVIAADAIWYLQNNGGDGDCWAYNNVRTGGAGAIGWQVPLDVELAAELRALAAAVVA